MLQCVPEMARKHGNTPPRTLRWAARGRSSRLARKGMASSWSAGAQLVAGSDQADRGCTGSICTAEQLASYSCDSCLQQQLLQQLLLTFNTVLPTDCSHAFESTKHWVTISFCFTAAAGCS